MNNQQSQQPHQQNAQLGAQPHEGQVSQPTNQNSLHGQLNNQDIGGGFADTYGHLFAQIQNMSDAVTAQNQMARGISVQGSVNHNEAANLTANPGMPQFQAPDIYGLTNMQDNAFQQRQPDFIPQNPSQNFETVGAHNTFQNPVDSNNFYHRFRDGNNGILDIMNTNQLDQMSGLNPSQQLNKTDEIVGKNDVKDDNEDCHDRISNINAFEVVGGGGLGIGGSIFDKHNIQDFQKDNYSDQNLQNIADKFGFQQKIRSNVDLEQKNLILGNDHFEINNNQKVTNNNNFESCNKIPLDDIMFQDQTPLIGNSNQENSMPKPNQPNSTDPNQNNNQHPGQGSLFKVVSAPGTQFRQNQKTETQYFKRDENGNEELIVQPSGGMQTIHDQYKNALQFPQELQQFNSNEAQQQFQVDQNDPQKQQQNNQPNQESIAPMKDENKEGQNKLLKLIKKNTLKKSATDLLKPEDDEEVKPTEPDDLLDNQQITEKNFYKEMQKIKTRDTEYMPPKKPPSAYIIFQKQKRQEILAVKPKAKVTEVVQEIAQEWQRLTKEERMPYKELARKDKDRYEKELKLLEAQSKKLKKPKKCLSAYMIFVKETRPTIVIDNPDLGALDIMKKVGEQWQSRQKIPNGIKEFQEKANKDKIRYLREQKAFHDEVENIHEKIHSNQKEQQENNHSQSDLIDQEESFRETEYDAKKLIGKRKSTTEKPDDIKNKQNSKKQKLQQSDNKNSEVLQIDQENAADNESNQIKIEKPKKPQNALCYLQQEIKDNIISTEDAVNQDGADDLRRQNTNSFSQRRISKLANEKWKSMTDTEKLKYSDMANTDKERHKQEMKEYQSNLKIQMKKSVEIPKKQIQQNSDDNDSSSLVEGTHSNQDQKSLKGRPKDGKPKLKTDYLQKQLEQQMSSKNILNQNDQNQFGQYQPVIQSNLNDQQMQQLKIQQQLLVSNDINDKLQQSLNPDIQDNNIRISTNGINNFTGLGDIPDYPLQPNYQIKLVGLDNYDHHGPDSEDHRIQPGLGQNKNNQGYNEIKLKSADPLGQDMLSTPETDMKDTIGRNADGASSSMNLQ